MSLHHPLPELLESFARADLDGSLATIVSAHIEHCSRCRKSIKDLEQSLSFQLFEAAPQPIAPQLIAMDTREAWQKLCSRLESSKTPSAGLSTQNEIHVNGLKFELPRVLQKFASKPIKWMPFGKGGQICKLGNEGRKSLFLIYLSSNEEVPLHSHAGAEHSYVISGSYSADGLTFETGDFSCSTESITHAPKAGIEDGCLLLSSVENRLDFLHGWLKPLNGLLWWILNVRVKLIK